MASRKPTANVQASLPFGALRLLAPPVRLVSAALWKVMKERDVMQYGIVEDFVTSACDTVPGLLTLRHRARLTLGLRARLVLELCREQPDPRVIAAHMERIRVPSSSSLNVDYKIKSAVENTHALVPKLLSDSTEKEHFYKNVFPIAYDANFDLQLEKLLWEFLNRLDQLLPVPSLAQTVSWLSDAPLILEECARAATQPQLLKILLQHQTCLGHLDPAASLPPNMGDNIISSLSLPPSGKEASDVPSGSMSAHKPPFIKPVIGLICNENVPLMMSLSQRSQSSDATNTNDYSEKTLLSKSNVRHTEVKEKEEKVSDVTAEAQRISGKKRKQIDCDSASDEEQIVRKIKGVKRRTTRNEGPTSQNSEAKDIKDMLQTSLHNMGYESLMIPEDKFLCSKWFSCLKSNPKVIIEKLLLTSACDADTNLSRTSLPVNSAGCDSVNTRSQRTMDCFSSSDNKENTPNLPRSRRSALRLKSNTEREDSSAELEDYVADSEDEATKNFKGRLFTKRYCKTKHGTYVPTLREYWKPCAERRNLLGPGSKQR